MTCGGFIQILELSYGFLELELKMCCFNVGPGGADTKRSDWPQVCNAWGRPRNRRRIYSKLQNAMRARKYGTVAVYRMTEKVREMTNRHKTNCRADVD
jgi:hypothetical protein